MSSHKSDSPGLEEEAEVALVEEVVIEVFGKRGEKPPRAKRYRIRIDREERVVDVPILKGREILALVGKTPESHRLYQHLHGNQNKPVEADEPVDLRVPGIERFSTIPRDSTEGRETLALCRDFRLPEEDEEYLDAAGRKWETVVEGANRWLILHGFEVPEGYCETKAKLALLIPTTYPDDQIDMMYFSPPLARVDGQTIGGLSSQVLRGENWQRWSRHRTGQNPWRIGVDNVSTHLLLVDVCLRREFEKG